MRLKREVTLGIGLILALQILLSVLAIALLNRMGPAIERILQENVYSGKAVEEMVALLALHSKSKTPPAFQRALHRAQNNVTERAERPLLAVIKRHHEAAFAGDPQARDAVILALQKLGQVNRDSMQRADNRAKRLGFAGAWAFAFLGALALGLGVVIYRRIQLRLERPIEEIHQTTQRIRAGNLQARCPSNDWPHEVAQIADDLNWLLDRWLCEGSNTPHPTEREAEIRRALAWLLDREDGPTVLVAPPDQRVAMNKAAMALLLEGDGRELLDSWETTEIPDTGLRFARPPATPEA